MEERLKEEGTSVELIKKLVERASGCIARHLHPAGHQTGHAVARALEEFCSRERDGQQKKSLSRKNNE